MTSTTAQDITTRLLSFDSSKTVLVDTGDGIFTINGIAEDTEEIIIYLGEEQ